MDKVTIIGIGGGTGSGKTTLANKIKEEFGELVTIMCHDYYYKAHDDIALDKRAKLNYDHPNAFDTDLLIADLKRLKAHQSIRRPVYDFTIHNRLKTTIEVTPTKVILLEGIMIFENALLRELMDIKVYVDTDADLRILRRLLRDVKERGRSMDSVITQYISTVKPMHDEFVEPYKKYADIIIPEGGQNVVALSMLIEKIKAVLH